MPVLKARFELAVTKSVPAPDTSAVVAVEKSDNGKLGGCSATYASQASCSNECPFFGNGCYGEEGHAGITTRRLNAAKLTRRVLIARQEARAVDGLSGKRPLRLHVVGDSGTRSGTRALARAARRYRDKHGQPVWTYTHWWRRVPRQDWGSVSVLASCETTADLTAAKAAGYATAVTVPDFGGHTAAYAWGEHKLLPCPYQTRGVKCSSCRLCLNDAHLKAAGLTIAFAAHGSGATKVRKALEVLS